MLHLTEEDVRRLLPMTDAVEQMRSAFLAYSAGQALNQPRRRLHLPTGAVLHSLAGSFGKYFGTKVYSTHPHHGAWFTFLLFDAETGAPLAQLEANFLGQIRTGAVSGLATDLLCRAREVEVGVIGSGFQARSQIEAIRAVRNIRKVKVWSRSTAKREDFASEVQKVFDIPAEACSSANEAVNGCQIVVTATFAKDPVLEEGAVLGETLVLAMGSNDPKRRELPSLLVLRAVNVVDDLEAAKTEAGDLLLALEDWTSVLELRHVAAGTAQPSRGRTIVFKSVGLGLEDVAAGALVYERVILERGPEPQSHAKR